MLIPNCQCQYFQMVFKMYCTNNRNNMAQKLKEITDIFNKFESEKNISVKKY